MRKGPRIYKNKVHLQQLGLVNRINQLVFSIALYAGDLRTHGIGRGHETRFDICQSLAAINRGFSCAQEIQIGAVEQKNVFCHVIASWLPLLIASGNGLLYSLGSAALMF
jgi:hypothetical protein